MASPHRQTFHRLEAGAMNRAPTTVTDLPKSADGNIILLRAAGRPSKSVAHADRAEPLEADAKQTGRTEGDDAPRAQGAKRERGEPRDRKVTQRSGMQRRPNAAVVWRQRLTSAQTGGPRFCRPGATLPGRQAHRSRRRPGSRRRRRTAPRVPLPPGADRLKAPPTSSNRTSPRSRSCRRDNPSCPASGRSNTRPDHTIRCPSRC